MRDGWEAFWSWSLPGGRWLGCTWRLHWTLLAFALFDAVGLALRGLPWHWWWAGPLVLPIAVLGHELGHRAALRLVGGQSGLVTLWPLGGIDDAFVPPRPAPQLLYAAAGPLASALLWGLATLAAARLGGGTGLLLAALATASLWLALANLVPIRPLDGGRLWRALLWPLVGRRAAVRGTLALGWVALALLVAWALLAQQPLLFLVAILMGVVLYREGQLIRWGHDPDGVDEALARPGLWARWRRWRAEQAALRDERRRAAAQAELDRLLAKVSQQGLAALTDRERQRLREISERLRRDGG